jgi:Fe-S-cluster containining protein
MNSETTFTPLDGKTFRFRCHREIACFTECCADLNLALTPYDVLRLKNRLGMSSADFLERYTEPCVKQQGRFPLLRLKMNQDSERRCPFVVKEGCEVYDDRPGACRIYPLGRAASKVDGGRETRTRFFLVREPHCLGLQEQKTWTIEEWLESEALNEYIDLNDQWLEITTSRKSLGRKSDVLRKIQMFTMASYNLDRFKTFVFESRFLDLFEVDPDLRARLRHDEPALLRFAMDWLTFSLFGEQTMKLKDAPPKGANSPASAGERRPGGSGPYPDGTG